MQESLDSPTDRSAPTFGIYPRLADHRAAVVEVGGDLDLVSAAELKRTLHQLLAGGHGQLVLDLSGVTFMDSTALGVVVAVQRRLAADERLAIAQPGPEVIRMFELSGLAATFRSFPTCDAALAYVRGEEDASSATPSPPMSGDAALTLGIAATAMPFAQSTADQAERWLRVLSRHGEAGVLLASIGFREAALRDSGDASTEAPDAGRDDVVAAVTDDARRIAAQRNAARIATTDLLLGVMHVYGEVFDRVLSAHGADVGELASRVASVDHTPADC